MSSDTNAKDTGRSLETTTSPSEEQPCSLTNIIPPSCQVCGRLLNDQGSTQQQQLGVECAELSATVLQVMVTEKHWTLEQIANLYGSTPENVMQKLHEFGMDIQEQQNIRTKSAAYTRKNASGGIHRTKRNKTTHNSKDFNKSFTSDPIIHHAARRKTTAKTNTLALKCPELVKEWHPTKNDRTPDQVTIGSHYEAWWLCSVNPKHEWQAVVKSRVGGRGCSYCSGHKVDESNSLLTLRPDLAKEWHPTKNGDLQPNQVTIGSGKEVWWLCSVNLKHEWQAAIYGRVYGDSCSYCAGRKVDDTNSLLSLRPDLAKEWHPTKNGDLQPSQVTIGSNKEVWWLCSVDPNHEWPATVTHRSYDGSGCPTCNDINTNKKWYPWEQFCGKLGKILYPSTFRSQPHTRLPNNKLPDFSYQNEKNEVIIADAKTNCWIPHIEDSISNYLPYCTKLEFWCLERKRDPEVRYGKIIAFLTPEDLLARISDKQLQTDLHKEIQKILDDT